MNKSQTSREIWTYEQDGGGGLMHVPGLVCRDRHRGESGALVFVSVVSPRARHVNTGMFGCVVGSALRGCEMHELRLCSCSAGYFPGSAKTFKRKAKLIADARVRHGRAGHRGRSRQRALSVGRCAREPHDCVARARGRDGF